MMKARIFIITAFAALMIGAVTASAEEVPEVTEPVFTEITEITETTTTTETTSAITLTEEVEKVPTAILGDVNSDSEVNVRDCAYIAKKLAEKKSYELTPETADYNRDNTVNIRDAASIANKLGMNLTQPKTFTAPNKADYNLKTIKGMKNYINDMVIYKAKMQYGIADIKADDTVKSNTWYSPTILLTDVNYYSTITSVDEYGFEGIMPERYVTTVDDAVTDLMQAFECISQRTNSDGSDVDMSKRRIRIKWIPIGYSDNCEIYVCYGGEY